MNHRRSLYSTVDRTKNVTALTMLAQAVLACERAKPRAARVAARIRVRKGGA